MLPGHLQHLQSDGQGFCHGLQGHCRIAVFFYEPSGIIGAVSAFVPHNGNGEMPYVLETVFRKGFLQQQDPVQKTLPGSKVQQTLHPFRAVIATVGVQIIHGMAAVGMGCGPAGYQLVDIQQPSAVPLQHGVQLMRSLRGGTDFYLVQKCSFPGQPENFLRGSAVADQRNASQKRLTAA